MKFIQVTDMHIMPPGERLLGLDPRAQLDACIADINAHHADAELCCVP
jgi:3',5'-cyclic AMP phosphodiesterase CpdA